METSTDPNVANISSTLFQPHRWNKFKAWRFHMIFSNFISHETHKSLRCISHVIHYTRLMCTSLLNAKKSTVAFLSTRVFSQSESLWQLINQSYCLHCRAVVTILLCVQRDKRGVFILSKSWETTFCESKILSRRWKLKLCNDIFSFSTQKSFSNPSWKILPLNLYHDFPPRHCLIILRGIIKLKVMRFPSFFHGKSFVVLRREKLFLPKHSS